MGLHLENEVAVVKTPTIISNNPVHSVGRNGFLNVNASDKCSYRCVFNYYEMFTIFQCHC